MIACDVPNAVEDMTPYTLFGMQRRIGFDRVIEADHVIPGTIASGGALCDARTIRVTRHPVSGPWLEDRPIWSRAGDTLDYSAAGIARYRCTRASVLVEPVADARTGWVEALLVATALPAVLWMQGAFVLHASAIVPAGQDRALAIAGRSGSGKSRLAAAFLQRGAGLVADDSIAIERIGDPFCSGLCGGYHLGTPGTDDRPFHRLPPHRVRRSAPLAAIVVLDEHARAPARLSGVEAVRALLMHRHRAAVPYQYGLEAEVLRDAAHLARRVTIASVPSGDADRLLDDYPTIMSVRGE